MNATTKIIKLIKKHPLTISRGTRAYSENIFLFLNDGINIGLGECDPGNFAINKLDEFLNTNNLLSSSIHEIYKISNEKNLPKPLQAAVDIALWDLLGKQSQLPCYKIFGLDPNSKPTSVTLGITPKNQIISRVHELLALKHFRSLKIKLGSPEGIERDQEAFLNIKQAAKAFDVKLRVDANGGWSLSDAKIMCRFLASHGVEYVEQPLSPEQDNLLPELFKTRALPIFVDESCLVSQDIVRLYNTIDGINIKLMKCGGITEALRMVAVARAHKLKTMIGCMSESSVSICAATSIASLFDYIDLDSAFNLNPDPARGINLVNGSLVASNVPGHGASLC